MSGEASVSLIVRVLVWVTRIRCRGAAGHLFERLAEPLQVDIGLLKGFGLSSDLDSSSDPRRKQQDTGDEQSNGESRKNRFIDRRRGFKQPEEIAKCDFLFLVLKKECQAQQ